jgi:general secretion pathway protein D
MRARAGTLKLARLRLSARIQPTRYGEAAPKRAADSAREGGDARTVGSSEARTLESSKARMLGSSQADGKLKMGAGERAPQLIGAKLVRRKLVVVLLLTVLVGGCAAGRAYRKGRDAARAGDWDSAVQFYTQALQANPDNAEYKIELERAMQNAAREHITRARDLEAKDQLDAALIEYKRAVEMDSTNRLAAAKAVELERTIRDRIEASRPKPAIEKLRAQARAQAPVLNPADRTPLKFSFNNASLRDILNFIGSTSGINIQYDATYRDVPYSVTLDGVPLEEALQQILSVNGFFYKVLNPSTILVAPDTPPMHQKYDEMMLQVFYLSHADAQDLSQVVNTMMRVQGQAVPAIYPGKTSNTLTVRATAALMGVAERLIRAHDKPRAEVVVEVQILEVNRGRAKQFGINLSDYSLGLTFSPEVAPPNTPGTTPPTNPPPFNLNTISQGFSTADFYLTVPTAVLRFLETDSRTKQLAKPQLRGAEGQELTLNLGDQIPVVSTVFGAAAPGGFASVPQSSFTYRDVGVNITMTPRVTYEGEIILDLTVESSNLGPNISVAGQDVPSFGSRRVRTRLRLREGESNLLAGLLRDDQRRIMTGLPGLMRVPGLRSLFGSTNDEISQTDIVMLLTPHIVRTHELTVDDLAPIYIGTQQSIGVGGPPPLIQPPAVEEPAAAAPVTAPVPQFLTPPATTPPAGTVPPVGALPTAPGTAVPRDPAAAPPATPAAPPAGAAAQIGVTAPQEFRTAGGPYTVPLSVSNASRLSTITLSVTFNPAVLRVRSVQEGTFMRQGGVTAMFTPRIDAATGRVDIAVTRSGDQAGASGSGLIGALLFDAIGPGNSLIQVSGVASTPEGTALPLQFAPASVTVRQ